MTKQNNLPWEMYSDIWGTKSKFFSWLRGGIRRSLWKNSPIKIKFIQANRKRIPNPNPRGRVETVWGADCYICDKTFPITNMDVDHRVGEHSLKEVEDITPFIEAISFVPQDALAFCCKGCHRAKSLAERKGISLNEALIEKQVIAILKEKKDKEWLVERGISPASNVTKRRQQIKEALTCIYQITP